MSKEEENVHRKGKEEYKNCKLNSRGENCKLTITYKFKIFLFAHQIKLN
jgi:hypothetical protein